MVLSMVRRVFERIMLSGLLTDSSSAVAPVTSRWRHQNMLQRDWVLCLLS